MRNKILFIFLILSIAKILPAQQNRVSGTIIDKTSRMPIEFAGVSLSSQADSTIVFVTVTDAEGNYILENIKEGSYKLNCFFMGYAKKDTLIILPAGFKKYTLQKIALSASSVNLKEVVVSTTTEKQFEVSMDRKIYHVGKDIQ